MRLRLAELPGPYRLGRNINHDSRSRLYALPESPSLSVEWERHIPILDQGNVGSCTGNATVGALGSGPYWDALAAQGFDTIQLDEKEALVIYSAAEVLDGGVGLPGEDQGSSGLSVAKVATHLNLINGYTHALSVAAAHTALNVGPFIIGTSWYSGMDSPGADGVVSPTGTVRGGHEYMCRQYDATRDLWWFDNSWGTSYGVKGRFAYDTPALTSLLSAGGDVTSFVPLSAPAPIPNPDFSRSFSAVAAKYLDTWAAAKHVGTNKQAALYWKSGK